MHFLFFWYTPPYGEISLDVEANDSIDSIRTMLQEIYEDREGIRMIPGRLKLFFCGRELEDDRTLADYGIEDYRTIGVFVLRAWNVQLLSGRTFKVYVLSADTIEEVKQNIYDRYLHIYIYIYIYSEEILPNQQDLMFASEELDNGLTVSCCNIPDKSTVSLLVSEPSSLIAKAYC